MNRWVASIFFAVLRSTVAAAVAAALILGPSLLPTNWNDAPSALAKAGGNGNGNNGNGNGNGGPNGGHNGNGNGGDQGGSGNNGNGGDQGGSGNNGNGKGGDQGGSGNNGNGNGGDQGGSGNNGNGGDQGGNGKSGSSGKGKKDKTAGNSDQGSAGSADATGQADQASQADQDQADQADEADQADQGDAANSANQPAPAAARRTAATAAATGRAGHDFVADEVVVANIDGRIRTAIDRLGFVLLDERRLPSLDLTLARLQVPRTMTAPAARTLLASRFPGIAVDLNALYRPEGILTLPAPDYPARLIGWGQVPTGCGRGLRVGLLDTAVDATMPGLRGADIVQRSFLPSDADAAALEHGSAIAWILVGRHDGRAGGLLPGAELAVANVFEATQDGPPTADVMALIGGLDWLAERGTPVINMSLAGEPNALVALALRRVMAGHAIVVAAAGNGGPTAAPAFPAAEPGVVAVTAVDSRAQPYPDANRGSYVAFAAPGVRVWTPGPMSSGSYHSGTSFAAPFVTAAAAARLAGGTPPDPARITSALAATARDLGAPGKDPVFGWGLLQATSPCTTLTQ